MVFVFDKEIIATENWIIKDKQIIAKEGVFPYWGANAPVDVVAEIVKQLTEHPSYLDLRSK